MEIINKQNCWEFKQCGRQSRGKNIKEYGVCPAALSGKNNYLNGGKFRGRVCWAIAGTFCGETIKGLFAKEIYTCLQCDFYQKVLKEEGDNFELLPPSDII